MSQLLPAAIGLYGIISYAVTPRTREIGVRMAHSAQLDQVLRLVVGQGLILTLVGPSVGLVVALARRHTIYAQPTLGVSATDPLMFVGVALVLVTVALVAASLPARRAAGVDPLVVARSE